MLESLCHKEKSFVTLTYSDASLPFRGAYATLVPKHLQDWLKRLRKQTSTLRIRYYGVGEYGERSWRPHFHVILFGYPSCKNIRTRRDVVTGLVDAEKCCSNCRLIFKTWGFGAVELGEVNQHSAGYIAGYVLKKMTKFNDMRLRGRHPEFARMSLKPGIGCDAMWDVASTLLRGDLDGAADVPAALRSYGKKNPIGRYLRQKLRVMIGRDPACPKEVLDALEAEMLELRLAARSSTEVPSFAKQIVNAGEVQRAQIVARNDIYKKVKVL